MDLEKIFRNLIIANLVGILLVVIFSFAQSDAIMEIIEYVPGGVPAGIYDTQFGFIATLILIVAFIVSLILLYRYVSFGKNLYVIVVAVGFALDLLGGTYILTSVSFGLVTIVNMIIGAILILLFFSPIKDKFIPK